MKPYTIKYYTWQELGEIISNNAIKLRLFEYLQPNGEYVYIPIKVKKTIELVKNKLKIDNHNRYVNDLLNLDIQFPKTYSIVLFSRINSNVNLSTILKTYGIETCFVIDNEIIAISELSNIDEQFYTNIKDRLENRK